MLLGEFQESRKVFIIVSEIELSLADLVVVPHNVDTE